ncbi:MAG: hypothetical protein AAF989_08630, partial [Planctomycetota bacterium]
MKHRILSTLRGVGDILVTDDDKTKRELNYVKVFVSDSVRLIGIGALALFMGSQLFGSPDFGITAWHLFAIGALGATAIGIGTL